MVEPLAASALDWVTALTASVLPEAQPFPTVHSGLAGLLDAIEFAPAARGWAGAMIRFEALVLSATGYGGEVELPMAETWEEILAGLQSSGVLLAEHLFDDRRRDVLAARDRMIDRLKRAAA